MRKKIIYVACILVIMLLLCSCHKRQPRPFLTKEDIAKELASKDAVDDEPDEANVITGEDFNLIGINYYTVNVATNAVICSTSMISDVTEVTPMLIADMIIDSLNDESLTLGVISAELSGETCIVDFDDSIRAYADNPDFEDAILDAIAQSILDNVEDCNSIVYRIMGKEYITENNSFSLNYVYMDN